VLNSIGSRSIVTSGKLSTARSSVRILSSDEERCICKQVELYRRGVGRNEMILLVYMLTVRRLGLWHCVASSSTFIAKMRPSALGEFDHFSLARASLLYRISQQTDAVAHQVRSTRNSRQPIRFLLVARARYVVGLGTIQGIWQYADRTFLCIACSMSTCLSR
jgi:hypothetical protein